jgi:plastocyanin
MVWSLTRQAVSACLAPLLLLAAPAVGGEIHGRVVVLEKSGERPLPAFDLAVVFVAGPPQAAPQTPAVMDQEGKRFVPRLLPVVQGQEVEFRNSDQVQHNVFSTHPDEPFDLGRYAAGAERRIRFRVLGPHAIYCDIHKSMIADVFVVPNVHFTVTDAQGRFTLPDVPPGPVRLRAWHIFGGHAAIEVMAGEQAVEVSLTLRSTKVVSEVEDHRDKSGRDYGIRDVPDYPSDK